MINNELLIDSNGFDWIGFKLARLQEGGLDQQQDDKTNETQANKKSKLFHDTLQVNGDQEVFFNFWVFGWFPNVGWALFDSSSAGFGMYLLG
jgi:hypothetical protein